MYSKVKKMTMDNVIETSSSNNSQIVVNNNVPVSNSIHAQPMSINESKTPLKNFNWKIYKFTIKQLNINAEYKALRHYQKYAKPGTKTYIKYLRNLYGIMPYFNETVYLKLTNMDENITYDQLYSYFRNTGHIEFPLNDAYDRLYYNIESYFDANSYYKRYENEINNYIYNDDNYDDNSEDWETGSQMSSITSFSQMSTMSTSTVNTKKSMLSTFINNANDHRNGRVVSQKERQEQYNLDEYNKWRENLYDWYLLPENNNRKIYKFFSEYKEQYPVDNKYYLMHYKIDNPLFDPVVYCKLHNVNCNFNNNNELNNLYKNFSKNNQLTDEYYRLYYNIPKELNVKTFIKRFNYIFENKKEFFEIINQEQRNFVYIAYNSLKDKYDFPHFDDIYFRIHYNIPEIFKKDVYLQRYSEIEMSKKVLEDVSRYVKISKETKYLYEKFNDMYSIKYPLDDDYMKLYYNIPEYFDYDLYLKLNPDVVKINELNNTDFLSKLSTNVRENIIFEEKCKIYNFYNSTQEYKINDTYFNTYYKQLYQIDELLDTTIYIEMYPNLKDKIENIEHNKSTNIYFDKYYEYLKKNLDLCPLDERYYRIKYNVPASLDLETYAKRYLDNALSIYDQNTLEYKIELYKLIDLENKPIDDKFYRIKYDIKNDFDAVTYVKRYPEINEKLEGIEENSLEYNKIVYEISKELLQYFDMDDKYFKLKYNISDIFHLPTILIYKNMYNIHYFNTYNNDYEAFKKEGYKFIDLFDDKYLDLLFNLPENFEWNIYYENNKLNIDNNNLTIFVGNNEKKIKTLCYYKTGGLDIMNYLSTWKLELDIKPDNNMIIEKKKYYNIELDFDYKEYSEKNPFFYINTRIKVTPDFVYLFYTEKIELRDIYNLFSSSINNKNIETIQVNSLEKENELKFINRYEYLQQLNISDLDFRKYFLLKDFVDEYYNNNDTFQYINKDFDDDLSFIKNIIKSNSALYKNYRNYPYLLNRLKNNEIDLLDDESDSNISYLYVPSDNTTLSVYNLIISLQFLPKMNKLFILTTDNCFDSIIEKFVNITKIDANKNIYVNDKIIKRIVKTDYLFYWNTRYVMRNKHIFRNNEYNSILNISRLINLDKCYNIGILRKINIENIYTKFNDDYVTNFREIDYSVQNKAYEILNK